MSKLHAFKKRTAIITIAAVLVLGGAGAAFAYWTSTGTGTGTATTGESTGFTVESDAPIGDPLTPGGPAQTVAFTVTNPGTGSQDLSDVTVTIANGDGTTWTAVDGCSAADYTVGTATIVYGPIAGGADAEGDVTVAMIDTGVNQDDCQNAVVPLYFVAS